MIRLTKHYIINYKGDFEKMDKQINVETMDREVALLLHSK